MCLLDKQSVNKEFRNLFSTNFQAFRKWVLRSSVPLVPSKVIPSTGETFPNASRGVRPGHGGIKLCTVAYKFISNVHRLNGSWPSTPPPYKG